MREVYEMYFMFGLLIVCLIALGHFLRKMYKMNFFCRCKETHEEWFDGFNLFHDRIAGLLKRCIKCKTVTERIILRGPS